MPNHHKTRTKIQVVHCSGWQFHIVKVLLQFCISRMLNISHTCSGFLEWMNTCTFTYRAGAADHGIIRLHGRKIQRVSSSFQFFLITLTPSSTPFSIQAFQMPSCGKSRTVCHVMPFRLASSKDLRDPMT